MTYMQMYLHGWESSREAIVHSEFHMVELYKEKGTCYVY